MTDEIKVSVSLRCTNGLFKLNKQPSTLSVDQTTASGGTPGVISVGFAAEEAINFIDVTPGYVLFVNTDATNFVQIGLTGSYPVRLPANGGMALFYVDTGKTLYALADTAACLVDISSVSV